MATFISAFMVAAAVGVAVGFAFRAVVVVAPIELLDIGIFFELLFEFFPLDLLCFVEEKVVVILANFAFRVKELHEQHAIVVEQSFGFVTSFAPDQ